MNESFTTLSWPAAAGRVGRAVTPDGATPTARGVVRAKIRELRRRFTGRSGRPSAEENSSEGFANYGN
jgi:hypothetical protein